MQEEKIPEDKFCCLNCNWFEKRTGFCRKNPPIPIPAYIKGVGTIANAAFPKISLPELDWCGEFQQKQNFI